MLIKNLGCHNNLWNMKSYMHNLCKRRKLIHTSCEIWKVICTICVKEETYTHNVWNMKSYTHNLCKRKKVICTTCVKEEKLYAQLVKIWKVICTPCKKEESYKHISFSLRKIIWVENIFEIKEKRKYGKNSVSPAPVEHHRLHSKLHRAPSLAPHGLRSGSSGTPYTPCEKSSPRELSAPPPPGSLTATNSLPLFVDRHCRWSEQSSPDARRARSAP
jgi:hypothetical protein